ncbi:hypothetical protein PSDI105340_09285 [Pseudoalteromonas distincta]
MYLRAYTKKQSAINGENLLVESVDRLSRLPQSDFEKLNLMIKKGLRLTKYIQGVSAI